MVNRFFRVKPPEGSEVSQQPKKQVRGKKDFFGRPIDGVSKEPTSPPAEDVTKDKALKQSLFQKFFIPKNTALTLENDGDKMTEEEAVNLSEEEKKKRKSLVLAYVSYSPEGRQFDIQYRGSYEDKQKLISDYLQGKFRLTRTENLERIIEPLKKLDACMLYFYRNMQFKSTKALSEFDALEKAERDAIKEKEAKKLLKGRFKYRSADDILKEASKIGKKIDDREQEKLALEEKERKDQQRREYEKRKKEKIERRNAEKKKEAQQKKAAELAKKEQEKIEARKKSVYEKRIKEFEREIKIAKKKESEEPKHIRKNHTYESSHSLERRLNDFKKYKTETPDLTDYDAVRRVRELYAIICG